MPLQPDVRSLSPRLPSPPSRDARGEGQPNPDGAIWRSGAFHDDAWISVGDTEPLPDAPAIISRTRWLAERGQLVDRDTPLGLRIEPGEAIDDVAADLDRFPVVALSFPKFRDGRAFSLARLLREKYGFAGELRAVGNVLADLIPFMRRVGFDSFEVTHAPTRRALAEGRIVEVTLHYQPAAEAEAPGSAPPWRRTARAR